MRKLFQRCIIFMLIVSLNVVIYLSMQMPCETAKIRHILCQKCDEKTEINDGIDQQPIKRQSRHLLCLVVPFRDRFEEMLVFVPEIHSYLTKKNIDHKILVMNQIDVYRFNRASLINVGYYESIANDCDYLAMHDVDLLPLNPNLDYGYPTSGPYHVASPEYHPKYHYKKFIGGILLLTLTQYESVDGMSNKYWGWGLEDDEFYLRLIEANLSINRPKNLSTDSTNTFRHVHDRTIRKRDTMRIGNQKRESRKRDRITGLKHFLSYEIDSRVHMQIGKASFTVINVKLKCNVTFTPWCEYPA